MAKAPPKPEFRTRRGTGAVVLAGVDGRSLMARRFREIVTGVEADLGGDLTEAQTALLARAATLAIWCEEREAELARGEQFDAAEYATIANAMRRLLADLGLNRVARDVTETLDQYLAKKGAANG
ncbi:hypothetical protein E1832_08600 [Antarcticimicrobium luteum]|uniref:Uncharacterized protein n=2 Tax=Antarcticimicrobium luteum TaxID=2547397 RepID=A0A4V3ASA0_9RHOB|nr:hypothetical protein E1832_08600 [Antarcticimicrobium luteum]